MSGVQKRSASTKPPESTAAGKKSAIITTTGSYELRIAIDATAARVWSAFIDETNAWWLPSFHMVGKGSVITCEARAGGHLIERHEDGGSLLWCTVQWCQPTERTLYLVGHVAPDWGGPAITMIKLQVKPQSGGCLLEFTDHHVGHVEAKNIQSLEEGWTQLLTEGLKAYVERGVRQDR